MKRRYLVAGSAAGVSLGLGALAWVLAGRAGSECQIVIATDLPIDPWATRELPTSCDDTPQPGAEAFRDMVIGGLGGTDLGIRRACAGKPPASLHHEGRAWDWGPPSPRRAWDFLDCATDGEAELARRAGIYEAIYERRIWTSDSRHWRPYQGPDPHISHAHFGLSRAGAAAQTSLYAILETGKPTTDATLEPSRRRDGYVHLAATGAAVAATIAGLALENL